MANDEQRLPTESDPASGGGTTQRLRYGVSFVVVIVAPLLLAVSAVAVAIGALSNGRIALAVLALVVAALSGILWILMVPAWYLALKG